MLSSGGGRSGWCGRSSHEGGRSGSGEGHVIVVTGVEGPPVEVVVVVGAENEPTWSTSPFLFPYTSLSQLC